MFGINIKGDLRSPTDYMFEQFAGLKLLIIDEISMTGQKLFGAINNQLMNLKKNQLLLGGVDLILSGDWLQNKPVAERSIYVPINPYQNDRYTLLRKTSLLVFDSINIVVMLNMNIRQAKFPIFALILSKFRLGIYEQEDLNYINDHSKQKGSKSMYSPYITGSNEIRFSINCTCLTLFIQSRIKMNSNRKPGIDIPFRWLAEFNCIGKSNQTTKEKSAFFKLSDDKTDRLPMILDLIIGMPVTITKNHNINIHLANGTLGTIVGFQHDPDNSFILINDDDYPYYKCTHFPQLVFVKLFQKQKVQIPCLPQDILPVPVVTLNSQIHLSHRHFSMKIKQIPIVPAYAVTVEKVQGLTLESVTICNLLDKRKTAQTSSLYVSLSRCKDPTQVLLEHDLTLEYCKSFIPNELELNITKHFQTKAEELIDLMNKQI